MFLLIYNIAVRLFGAGIRISFFMESKGQGMDKREKRYFWHRSKSHVDQHKTGGLDALRLLRRIRAGEVFSLKIFVAGTLVYASYLLFFRHQVTRLQKTTKRPTIFFTCRYLLRVTQKNSSPFLTLRLPSGSNTIIGIIILSSLKSEILPCF